jgi:hypothetical protein
VTAALKRRLRRLLLPLLVILAYVALRTYADSARSMEAVLGLFHGDPTWHALVASTTIVLRFAAYGMVGGTALAWPLEEWLLTRVETTSE